MAANQQKLDAFKQVALTQGYDPQEVEAFVAMAGIAGDSKDAERDTELQKWVDAVNKGYDVSGVPIEYRADVLSKTNASSGYTPSWGQPTAQPTMTPPMTPSPTAPVAPTAPPQNMSMPTDPMSQPGIQTKETMGLVGKIAKALTQPFVNTGKNIGSAVFETARAGATALRPDDKNKYSFYVDPETGETVQNPFMNEEELAKVSEKPSLKKDSALRQQLSDSASIASWAVPFGKGANLTSKVLAPGAAVGAMNSLDPGLDIQDVPGNVAMGAATGAVGAGVLHGAGKLVGGSYRFIKNQINKPGLSLANNAAKEIGGASPTVWRKVAEEHGWDLNQLIKKYYPSGSTYDDVIGTISQRGNGGTLGSALAQAENKIQQTVKASGANFRITPDGLLKSLKQEARIIKQEIGGEVRAKALAKVIKQVEKKYAKGASLNQLMTTLRAANKKFGKNIVEVSGADAIVSASQKLEANTIRRTVKGLFPELADALETEAQIYTLRPILSHARGIQNTQGSAIRQGLRQFDLTRPFTWFEPVEQLIGLNSAQGKSKLLGLGESKLALNLPNLQMGDKTASLVGDLTGQAGARIGSSVVNNMSQEPATPAINTDNQQDSENNVQVTPPEQEIITLNQFGATPKQIYAQYENAKKAGDTKTADDLYKMFKDEVDWQEKNNKTTKLTATEKASESVQALSKKASQMLSTGNIKTGKIGGKAESLKANVSMADSATYDFNVTISNLKATIAKARAGSAFTPNEEKLLNSYVPLVGDSKQQLETKLRILQTDEGKSAVESLLIPEIPNEAYQALLGQGGGQGGGGMDMQPTPEQEVSDTPVLDKIVAYAVSKDIEDAVENPQIIAKAAEVLLKSGHSVDSKEGQKLLDNFFTMVEKAVSQGEETNEDEKSELDWIIGQAKQLRESPGLDIEPGYMYR